MPHRHRHSPWRTPSSASTAHLLERLERFHHVVDGEFVEIVASHGDQAPPLVRVLAEAHRFVEALDRSRERGLMLARLVESHLHCRVEIGHRIFTTDSASASCPSRSYRDRSIPDDEQSSILSSIAANRTWQGSFGRAS